VQELDERTSGDERAQYDGSIERSRERRAGARRRRRRTRLVALLAPPVAALAGALAVTAAPKLWQGLPSLDAVDAGATVSSHGDRSREGALVARSARGNRAGSERSGQRSSAAAPVGVDADHARRYVDSRAGSVSFAVIDPRGEMHGVAGTRAYVSASAVKALLLAAELRRLDADGAPLDGATRETLRAMITYSDNDAADSIYYRVGDAGLNAAAARAGMEDFSVAGYWANAQITAADMARFFWRLDRAFASSHREFAKGLLGSVIEGQRWGIPAAAGERWSVRFKGGWRATELGQLAHQGAELRRAGERISIAVLTDAQPSQAYAQQTIRGVAERLLPE
jgi:hypothetical protein